MSILMSADAMRLVSAGASINGIGDSISAQSLFNPSNTPPATFAAWAPSTAYATGACVSNGGLGFYCSTAGTSASSGGPTSSSSSITDGSVTWQQIPAVTNKEGFLGWAEAMSQGLLHFDQTAGYGGPQFTLRKVLVINGGSNYSANPTITLNGGALATATVVGGAITAVTLTNPGFYQGGFSASVSDASGSGAVLSVVQDGSGTFAVYGCKTADMVARLPDALASNVSIFTVHGGRNDIAGQAVTAANMASLFASMTASLQKIYETLMNAQRCVIAVPILPCSTFDGMQSALAMRVNRWIRSYVRQLAWANPLAYTRIALADATKALVDGTALALFAPVGGAGGTAAAVMTDGTHPSTRGRAYIGAVVWQAAQKFVGPPPLSASRVYSAADGFDAALNPGGNLLEALPWASTTAYAVGQQRARGGNVYRCTAAGTSSRHRPVRHRQQHGRHRDLGLRPAGRHVRAGQRHGGHADGLLRHHLQRLARQRHHAHPQRLGQRHRGGHGGNAVVGWCGRPAANPGLFAEQRHHGRALDAAVALRHLCRGRRAAVGPGRDAVLRRGGDRAERARQLHQRRADPGRRQHRLVVLRRHRGHRRQLAGAGGGRRGAAAQQRPAAAALHPHGPAVQPDQHRAAARPQLRRVRHGRRQRGGDSEDQLCRLVPGRGGVMTMRRMLAGAAALASLVLLAGRAEATTYYVASCGDDGNTGLSATCGTSGGPWKTSDKAGSAPAPGSTVVFAAGTFGTLDAAVPGLSHAQPTTYLGAAGFGTKLVGGSYEAVYIQAPHVRVGAPGQGFDITGPSSDAGCIEPVQNGQIYDTVIDSNYVHDCPGGGIAFEHVDYTYVVNNIVARSGYGYWNQGSGITVGFGQAQAAYTPVSDFAVLPYGGYYRTLISGNVSYGNSSGHQLVTWSSATAYTAGQTVYALDNDGNNYLWTAATGNTNSKPVSGNAKWTRGAHAFPVASTDGNGIIIDTNSFGPYTGGPALVENNITWGNGGRGVHCLRSNGVVFRHNTSYGNLQDRYLDGSGYEIGSTACPGVEIYNNAVQATQAAANISSPSSQPVGVGIDVGSGQSVMDGNVAAVALGNAIYLQAISGAPAPVRGSGNLLAAPGFAAPMTSTAGMVTPAAAAAAFAPAVGSPLLGKASALSAPAMDVLGLARSTAAGRLDVGAVQVTP